MRRRTRGAFLPLPVFLTLALCEVFAMDKPGTTELPIPRGKSGVSLEEAVAWRRSVRTFAKKDLGPELLGQLLWAAQGLTAPGLRAAPSAGALYPLEIYAVTKSGVFNYVPRGHRLRRRLEGDRREELAVAALEQGAVSAAPLDLVLCAVYPRITGKYGERGVRYAHLEAGHIAQNVQLQAAALGLVSVPVGAFDDAGVGRALALPEDCEPVYIIPVGYPAAGKGGKEAVGHEALALDAAEN